MTYFSASFWKMFTYRNRISHCCPAMQVKRSVLKNMMLFGISRIA